LSRLQENLSGAAEPPRRTVGGWTKIKMREITLSDLKQIGNTGRFRHAIRNDIFVIRQAPPFVAVREQLLREFHAEHGPDETSAIVDFLDTGVVPPDHALAHFVNVAEVLRDSRAFSRILVELVSSLGCDDDKTLIDTGHLRIVVPSDVFQRMLHMPELRDQYFGRRDVNDVDVMLVSDGARAHRDIQAPHYTTQVNFWFPLHRLEVEESLILFPDVAGISVASYSVPPDVEPEGWGFGVPARVALNVGDSLLFHSEQFHASPVGQRLRPRISMEIRATLGCLDDNAIYRRLFWSVKNLRTRDRSPGCKGPAEGKAFGSPLTWHSPADLYGHLFTDPKAARLASEAVSTSDEIAKVVRPRREDILNVAGTMLSEEIGADLAFFCAKLLVACEAFDRAWDVVTRILEQCDSYFWALECARLAAKSGNLGLCRSAIDRAEQLAAVTTVSFENVGAPDLHQPPFQMLPMHALEACASMREAVKNGSTSRHHLDSRLFSPQVSLVKSFVNCDLIKFQVRYLAVPPGRAVLPHELMLDPSGVVWGSSPAEVTQGAGHEIDFRPNRVDRTGPRYRALSAFGAKA
jgi:hypothetical protein